METRTKILLGQPGCQIGTKTGRHKQPWYIACYNLKISTLHSVSGVIPEQEDWIYGERVSGTFFFMCQMVLNVIQ